MSQKKYIFEGVANFKSEDSGAARIAEIEGESYDDIGNGTFVQLQSWDETVWGTAPEAHAMVRELEGKKVRITVEVIK